MISIKSHINPSSAQFKDNKAAMEKLLEKLEGHLEESRFEGKDKHIDKARSRNKMLARERIEMVLDQDSPFLELLPLAGMKRKGGFGAGGTNVSGIGIVSGKLCMINSNVGTRKGGSVDYATVFKGLRIGDITRDKENNPIQLFMVFDIYYDYYDSYFRVSTSLLRDLNVTWEHPFFVLRNGSYRFKQALELKVGDRVYQTTNYFTEITAITRVDEEIETVNINVEPYDVYFAEGILLHNVHDKDG